MLKKGSKSSIVPNVNNKHSNNMKEQILQILTEVSKGEKCPEHAQIELLGLFSGSISIDEIEKMKRLAHEGLPDDCVNEWNDVKFCHYRQGDGNMCKHCSNYC